MTQTTNNLRFSETTTGGLPTWVGEFTMPDGKNNQWHVCKSTSNNKLEGVFGRVTKMKDGSFKVAVADCPEKRWEGFVNIEKFDASTIEAAFETAISEMVKRGVSESWLR